MQTENTSDKLSLIKEPLRSMPAIRNREQGSSLVEVVCAMTIILVAVLGVAFAFTYAINYNAGNNSRSKALAVLQQEVEQLRAAKFTPTVTDAALAGGTRADRTVIVPTGERFTVSIAVDNDPSASGVQDDAESPGSRFKEVVVTTRLSSPSPGWQTAVPSTVILRRTRSN